MKHEWVGLSDGVAHVAQRKTSCADFLCRLSNSLRDGYRPPGKDPAIESGAIYARVPSADQKADVERQLRRLTEYALQERLTVVRSASKNGSGLDGDRVKTCVGNLTRLCR